MSKFAKLETLLTTLPIKAYSATQLRHLAKLTGVNSTTGTKAALASSILAAVKQTKDGRNGETPRRSQRVLSIDMGVTNLAYCTLERSLDKEIPPVIREWNRISVLEPNDSVSFSTPDLAQAAVKLIGNLVLSKPKTVQPAHILIERQRWRTMGGPRVLEWTIRVNTLEAMIWATLSTVQNEGLWNGQIHAVDPGRVASCWLDSEPKSAASAGKKYQAMKLAKVNLVRSWFESGAHVTSGSPDCATIQEAFMSKMKRRQRGSKEEKTLSDEFDKLDDLADSVLQGVTFLKWLQNRELLAETGEEGLNVLLAREEQSKTTA